jgi:hypothetical protein
MAERERERERERAVIRADFNRFSGPPHGGTVKQS